MPDMPTLFELDLILRWENFIHLDKFYQKAKIFMNFSFADMNIPEYSQRLNNGYDLDK